MLQTDIVILLLIIVMILLARSKKKKEKIMTLDFINNYVVAKYYRADFFIDNCILHDDLLLRITMSREVIKQPTIK